MPGLHRFRQFSLRAALLLTVVCCLACGWLGYQLKAAREREQAVQFVEQMRGGVMYKHEADNWEKPNGSPWLRKALGAHFFDRVVHVGFGEPGAHKKQLVDLSFAEPMDELRNLMASGTALSDLSALSGKRNLEIVSLMQTRVDSLDALASHTKLKWLFLNQCPLDDISPLSNAKLERLSLRRTEVSDLSALNIERLEWIDLGQTKVHDLTPLANAKALRVLILSGTKVTSLAPLHQLTQLKKLDITQTNVSPDEVARLQRALPDCRIDAPQRNGDDSNAQTGTTPAETNRE